MVDRSGLAFILLGYFLACSMVSLVPTDVKQTSTRFARSTSSLDLRTHSKMLRPRRSEVECALQCSQDTTCQAFHFNRPNSQCILASTDPTLEDTVIYSMWLYHRLPVDSSGDLGNKPDPSTKLRNVKVTTDTNTIGQNDTDFNNEGRIGPGGKDDFKTIEDGEGNFQTTEESISSQALKDVKKNFQIFTDEDYYSQATTEDSSLSQTLTDDNLDCKTTTNDIISTQPTKYSNSTSQNSTLPIANANTTSDINDNPQTTSDINDNPQTTSDINDNPLTTSDINDNPQTSSDINNNPQTTSDTQYNDQTATDVHGSVQPITNTGSNDLTNSIPDVNKSSPGDNDTRTTVTSSSARDLMGDTRTAGYSHLSHSDNTHTGKLPTSVTGSGDLILGDVWHGYRQNGCNSDYIPSLDKCVSFHTNVTSLVTWTEARSHCEINQGQLIDFHSSDEFLRFRLVILANSTLSKLDWQLGLGLYSTDVKWHWVNSGVPVPYSDGLWAQGKPSSGVPAQNGGSNGQNSWTPQPSWPSWSRHSWPNSQPSGWSGSGSGSSSASGSSVNKPQWQDWSWGSGSRTTKPSGSVQISPVNCACMLIAHAHFVSDDSCVANRRHYICQYRLSAQTLSEL